MALSLSGILNNYRLKHCPVVMAIVRLQLSKSLISHVHNSGKHAGWVGGVPLGIKLFFDPPFLLLKAPSSSYTVSCVCSK